MSSNRKVVTLLPGDFYNLGDAMLSLAAARRLASEGHAVVLLPYRSPDKEIKAEFEREGFEAFGMRKHPWRALRRCLSGNMYLGGGQAVRNEVSLGWLTFTFIASRLARAVGHQVRLVGAGVAPVNSGWRRALFRGIFAACDRLCVRDPISRQRLQAHFPAFAEKVSVSGDLAFLTGCLNLADDLVEPSTCLVSLGVDVGEGRAEDPEEIIGLLRGLAEHHGMDRVILVSHDCRDEFGLAACTALASRIEAALKVSVETIAKHTIGEGLLRPYSRARWIITGRLHGLILGAKLARSVVYTTSSASKLQPFATLFGYVHSMAEFDERAGWNTPRVSTPLQRQESAAEANFV